MEVKEQDKYSNIRVVTWIQTKIIKNLSIVGLDLESSKSNKSPDQWKESLKRFGVNQTFKRMFLETWKLLTEVAFVL